MKNIYLLLGLMTFVLAAPLAANADDLNCDDPQTTLAIKQCLSAELGVADAALNRVYKAVREDQDDEANELLKTTQRAWITYRDAECDRMADVARGGTLAGVLVLSCHVDMTTSRTKELAINPISGEVQYQ